MDKHLSLVDFLRVGRERWFILIGCPLLLVGVIFVWSTLQTPLYRAEARIQVTQNNASEILDPLTGQSFGGVRAISNEAEFAKSDVVGEVADAKLSELGVLIPDGGRGAILFAITTTESDSADVFTIRAVGEVPSTVALVAETYADTFVEQRREQRIFEYRETATVLQRQAQELEAEIEAARGVVSETELAVLETQRATFLTNQNALVAAADLGVGGGARVIAKAGVPESPFSPRTTRNLAVGLLLGLLVGLTVALIVDATDHSIRTKAELEAATPGVSLLATVPTIAGWRDRSSTQLVTLEAEKSTEAEAYRTLRASLGFVSIDRKIKSLQVTSANPGEGKTTTSVNLAIVMAQTGRRVVLVDADLRKPRVHSFLGLEQEPGLTNVAIGETSLEETVTVIREVQGLLGVLTSGPVPPGPSELLGSRRVAKIFSALEQVADLIIVDSPPVLAVADALVLSQHVDATLLVVNGSRTDAPDVRAACDALDQVDGTLVGTVLNQVRKRRGGYGYGYGYGYGDDRYGSRRLGFKPARLLRPKKKNPAKSTASKQTAATRNPEASQAKTPDARTPAPLRSSKATDTKAKEPKERDPKERDMATKDVGERSTAVSAGPTSDVFRTEVEYDDAKSAFPW